MNAPGCGAGRVPSAPALATSASGEATPARARAWLASGQAALVVSVLGSRGSVPRGDGTRMLVSAHATAGTIGGGHLEFQAIERARRHLREAGPGAAGFDWPVALGPSLGQCCGGALTLRFAPLDEQALAEWPQPPARLRLHLFGAGHVGRAIVHVLAQLPCEVWWIDEREEQLPAQDTLPAHIRRVCVDAVEAEVAQARPGDAFLVLTHSHALDERLTEAILRRGDFGWLGLIGSASKRARFTHRLRERGLAPGLIERITCPIGLPGLGGKEPGVIAVAVAAQLLSRFTGQPPGQPPEPAAS